MTQAARSRDPRCICCRNNIKSIVYAAFIVKNLHNSSKTMLSILFPVFSLIGLAPSCTLLSHSSTSSYCLYPCKNKENGMFFFVIENNMDSLVAELAKPASIIGGQLGLTVQYIVSHLAGKTLGRGTFHEIDPYQPFKSDRICILLF